MKKEEIKKHLAAYSNILEMMHEANNLKAKGESEIMVNRCVAELRKEALNHAESAVKLTKSQFEETEIQPVTYLNMEVKNLASPKVYYQNGVITL